MKKRFIKLSHSATVEASVSTSDIERDFYNKWAVGDRYWWWLCLILVDPLEAIVEDEEENLYRVPITTNADGSVNFGELSPIKIEFVDVAAKHEAVRAAVSGIVAVRGDKRIAAKYESREESRRNVATKGDVQVREYIERMRAKLGLAADSTDAQILAAVAAHLEAHPEDPDAQPPAVDPVPDPAPDPDPAPTPDPVPVTPGEGQPQSVTVDASALAALQADAAAGREARQAQLAAEDQAFVEAAVKKGKIPPAGKSASLKRMARDRDEERAYLDSLAENVIPIAARGGAGTDAPTPIAGAGHPQLDTWLAANMPNEFARKQRIVQRGGAHPRVMTDGATALRVAE